MSLPWSIELRCLWKMTRLIEVSETNFHRRVEAFLCVCRCVYRTGKTGRCSSVQTMCTAFAWIHVKRSFNPKSYRFATGMIFETMTGNRELLFICLFVRVPFYCTSQYIACKDVNSNISVSIYCNLLSFTTDIKQLKNVVNLFNCNPFCWTQVTYGH